jgi:hypothetical protein
MSTLNWNELLQMSTLNWNELLSETICFFFSSVKDFIICNISSIYLSLVVINLFSLYLQYYDNRISILEQKLSKNLLNIDICDSSSDSETEDTLEKVLYERVAKSKKEIIDAMYILLEKNPSLKNTEVSKKLGLTSLQHSGYITLIFLKENPELFIRDDETKLWNSIL